MNPRTMAIREIMQTEVTSVSPETDVGELTRLLVDQGISGAPVVTTSGALVGVVSSADVVRLTAESAEVRPVNVRWAPRVASESWDADPDSDDPRGPELYASYFLPEDAPPFPGTFDDGFGPGGLHDLSVGDIMTPVSFTVSPTATVRELADFLLRGRIHRAIVTDEGRLVGIVTTMDVLRALAEADS